MRNIIQYRKWWYIISFLILTTCVASLVFWGLKPSIDFTGGTQIEISGTTDKNAVESIAKDIQFENFTITPSDSTLIFRTKKNDPEKEKKFKTEIESNIPGARESRVDAVGPSISQEITRNAFIMIAIASAVIIIYVAIMFRKVPRPATGWEFGTTAIVALIHDIIIVLGVFSLLGYFLNVEVDPLFITAVLTIIGFSVHDTIVIFDRIRENLIRASYPDFETTVSISIYEMLPRTLNTSFLVWIILTILYLFGGETIKYFVLALMVGIFAGTYSSILVASPLLITWQELKEKRKKS